MRRTERLTSASAIAVHYITHIHMRQLTMLARNAVISVTSPTVQPPYRSLKWSPCGLSSSTSSLISTHYPECHKVFKSTVSRPPFATVPQVSQSPSPPANVQGAQTEILTGPALAFLAALHRTFDATRLSVRPNPSTVRAELTSFDVSAAPRRSPYHPAASRRGGTTQLPVGDRTCPR